MTPAPPGRRLQRSARSRLLDISCSIVAGPRKSACSRCEHRETRRTTPDTRARCRKGSARARAGEKPSGDAGRNDELASFAENDEPVAGQRHRSGQEPILVPANLAGSQFDGAEALAKFLAPVEPIQDAIVVDAGRIVVGQGLIGRPDLVERRAVEAEDTRRQARTRPRRRSNRRSRVVSRRSPMRPSARATGAETGPSRSRDPARPVPRA